MKIKTIIKSVLLVLIIIPILLIISIKIYVWVYRDYFKAQMLQSVSQGFIMPMIDFAIITQLFSNQFPKNEEALPHIEELKRLNLKDSETKDLLNFLEIKKALVYHKTKFAGLPSTLNDLGLAKQNLTDKWGNGYHYAMQDKYVLLGTAGEDGRWDLNDSLKKVFVGNKNEFVFKFHDDFLIKIIPDSTPHLNAQ